MLDLNLESCCDDGYEESSREIMEEDEGSTGNFIDFIGIVRNDGNVPSDRVNPTGGEMGLCMLRQESGDFDGGDKEWLNLSSSCGGDYGEADDRKMNARRSKEETVKKSRRGPKSRSSEYRGVTFYRRTGRWESHIWDCGKQVYLGGFDTAYAAARAYDRAAVKFRGIDADINFDASHYDDELEKTQNLSKQEFVQILRRESNGGSSRSRDRSLWKSGMS